MKLLFSLFTLDFYNLSRIAKNDASVAYPLWLGYDFYFLLAIFFAATATTRLTTYNIIAIVRYVLFRVNVSKLKPLLISILAQARTTAVMAGIIPSTVPQKYGFHLTCSIPQK